MNEEFSNLPEKIGMGIFFVGVIIYIAGNIYLRFQITSVMKNGEKVQLPCSIRPRWPNWASFLGLLGLGEFIFAHLKLEWGGASISSIVVLFLFAWFFFNGH
jgi:hypothetical protein